MRTRRASTRREVRIECQAVRERDFKLVGTRTIDLSPTGMLVASRLQVLTGDDVIVSFRIGTMWVDAEAMVSRIVHGRRPHDDETAVALTFVRVDPSARAALAAFLFGRPPPLPRRGPLARLRRGGLGPIMDGEFASA